MTLECPLCGYSGDASEFLTEFVIPICRECYITMEEDECDGDDE